MTGAGPGDSDPPLSSDGGAPVDFARLDEIADRFAGDRRFARVIAEPSGAPDQIRCVYSERLYPQPVSAAHVEIVWFENDDFSIHYHESHRNGAFDHRWDRHPSGHNTRDHVHPRPDAPTPGRDADHPVDWRDVLSTVLAEIEQRQRGFWPE